MMSDDDAVIFFDLSDVSTETREMDFILSAEATAYFREYRKLRNGILCERVVGLGGSHLRWMLERLDLEGHFDRDLIVVASDFGLSLSEPRTYRVAAAFADATIDRCILVSAQLSTQIAAATAGMKVISLTNGILSVKAVISPPNRADLAESDDFVLLSDNETMETNLVRGQVEEQTYILKGRVVTMNASLDVFDDGAVVIQGDSIHSVLRSSAAIPDEFDSVPIIETEGTIYPGLVDLHNHFVYNVLPLWVVPKRFDNRSQWPRHREYRSNVSLPIRGALARFSVSAEAIVRFVETKAIMGGTTTGQGIRTRIDGGISIFKGAMRNVERTGNSRLPEARTRVPDLTVTGARGSERIESFRNALQDTARRGAAYFYHLSEGTDATARNHFFNLSVHGLIRSSLVGIHSLGLKRDDLDELAREHAKIVWSPFSNLLLYGATLDLREVRESGVKLSMGCDWGPSGSKNLLQELKVADFENERQGAPFSQRDLVQMVTSDAAAITGWDRSVGSLIRNGLADILVIRGANDDPYSHLIKATDVGVRLVVIDGTPRYGDANLMQAVHAGQPGDLEAYDMWGNQKLLYTHSQESPINHVSFSDATTILGEAMADLPGFVEAQEAQEARLESMGVTAPQRFTIELDNEFNLFDDPLFEVDDADWEAELLADVPMADWLEFHTAVIDPNEGDYWERITNQPNLSDELKAALMTAYGVVMV